MGRRGSPLPIMICVDVEPDPRVMPRGDYRDWPGFERFVEFWSAVRTRLAEATGAPVHVSWFLRMDPQIADVFGSPAWVMDRYGAELKQLEAEGDEIGLHIHPWRWNDTLGWVADFADAAWGRYCVEMGFSAYAEVFRRPCRSIRFGDRWLTSDIMGVAQSAGARFDLTAEPGWRPRPMEEPTVGTMADFSTTPHRAYRPSPNDPTRSGGGSESLWMFPLTTLPGWGFGQQYSHRVATLDDTRRSEGPFQGHLDAVNCDMIGGWAVDHARPDHPVDVAVYADRQCIAIIPAGDPRPDLVSAGIGTGAHGFTLQVGRGLQDGRRREIRARIVGTDHWLTGGPVPLRCDTPPDPTHWLPLNLSYFTPVVAATLHHLAQHAKERTHIAAVTRTDVMVSEKEFPHFVDNLEHLAAFARQSRARFVTPPEALALVTARLTRSERPHA